MEPVGANRSAEQRYIVKWQRGAVKGALELPSYAHLAFAQTCSKC